MKTTKAISNLLIFSILIIACLTGNPLVAQVAVNTDGSSANPSAMLDVKSTGKGVLAPRMSQAEIETIAGPSDGLIVYNTDDSHFYIFDEADVKWKEVDIGTGTIHAGCGTVTDIDGNTYPTIIIGTQCWMKENLKTTRFSNGNPVPLVTSSAVWSNTSNTRSPAFCWYNNSQGTYGNTYGALYNWYAVGRGNLCPTGWHVPSHDEWTILSNFLGGSLAGGKLKEIGFIHWISPNTGATNESGFTALPGGRRSNTGSFSSITAQGNWWSSVMTSPSSALFRYLSFNSVYIGQTSYPMVFGHSVRCLKD